MTFNIGPDGKISGWDDNCGSCAFQVGGKKTGTDLVLFLDYSPEDCGASFRYGIVIGTGLKGTLYRYFTDGTPAAPVKVKLVPCAEISTAERSLGPSSKVK